MTNVQFKVFVTIIWFTLKTARNDEDIKKAILLLELLLYILK